MKQIQLNLGKVALVDDEDYVRVSQFKWIAFTHGNTWYAARRVSVNGKWTTQKMHQLIIGDNPLKLDIDHIDGDGLNNQKSNLRLCTHRQNMMNRKPNKNSSSVYKGVVWHKSMCRWRALIRIEGKLTHLGLFIIEEDAAIAYDTSATENFGEFARINFPKIKSEIACMSE